MLSQIANQTMPVAQFVNYVLIVMGLISLPVIFKTLRG